MSNSIRIACVQINSKSDVEQNLNKIEHYLADAKVEGSDIVLLPENFAQMPSSANVRHIERPLNAQSSGRSFKSNLESRDTFSAANAVQSFLVQQANKLQMTIIAGSLPIIESQDQQKPFARCLIVEPDKGVTAYYDKIHLFDVDTQLDGVRTRYSESKDFKAGSVEQLTAKRPSNLVTLEINKQQLNLGLSICYDLRFPEFYRRLAEYKADIIVIPSAFTFETGEKHWEVLLRSRAIENQCFVVAAGQCGTHEVNGKPARHTWGHSMVIDPDGKVGAALEHQEGLLFADIDLNNKHSLAQRFPVLSHRTL